MGRYGSYIPNKYKPGDCVTFIGDDARFYGRKCTILSVETLFSPYPIYHISFGDDSGPWLCSEERLGDICEDDSIIPEDIELLL